MTRDTDLRSDAELLEALRNSDQTAERVLYQRYSDYALNIATRFLRNGSRAEDVVQDARLSLRENISKHGPPVEFRSYFAAVIVNQCRKVLKSRWEVLSLDEAVLRHLEKSAPEYVASEENISEKLERDELVKTLHKKLKKLSQTELTALGLRYFHNYSYAEMAAELGKTESHTRVITHRALNALRREMRDH